MNVFPWLTFLAIMSSSLYANLRVSNFIERRSQSFSDFKLNVRPYMEGIHAPTLGNRIQCAYKCMHEKTCVSFWINATHCEIYSQDIHLNDSLSFVPYRESQYYEMLLDETAQCKSGSGKSTCEDIEQKQGCIWESWSELENCENERMSRTRVGRRIHNGTCKAPAVEQFYCGDTYFFDYHAPLPYANDSMYQNKKAKLELKYIFYTDAAFHSDEILIDISLRNSSGTYQCDSRDLPEKTVVTLGANMVLPTEFTGEYSYVTKQHFEGLTTKEVGGCTLECIVPGFHNIMELRCCAWEEWNDWVGCTNNQITRVRNEATSNGVSCEGPNTLQFYCGADLKATYHLPLPQRTTNEWGSSLLKRSFRMHYCFKTYSDYHDAPVLVNVIVENLRTLYSCAPKPRDNLDNCVDVGANLVMPTEFVGDFGYLTQGAFNISAKKAINGCKLSCRSTHYYNYFSLACCRWEPWTEWSACQNQQMRRTRATSSLGNGECDGDNEEVSHCGGGLIGSYIVPRDAGNLLKTHPEDAGSLQISYCFFQKNLFHTEPILTDIKLRNSDAYYACGQEYGNHDCVNVGTNIVFPTQFAGIEYSYVTKSHFLSLPRTPITSCKLICKWGDYYNTISLDCS